MFSDASACQKLLLRGMVVEGEESRTRREGERERRGEGERGREGGRGRRE